jgi:hypothetical protein
MNDSIKNLTGSIADTFDITNDTTKNVIDSVADTFDIWMLVALVEMIIIVFLLHKIMKRKHGLSDRERFKQNAMEGEIDFGNTIKSVFQAKQLYDELKKKCHPDLFPNDADKIKTANEIFQEISKNRHNFKKLLELKERAKQQLNINI